jgi:hypothetical protein
VKLSWNLDINLRPQVVISNPLCRTWNRLLYRQFFGLKLPCNQNRVLRVFKRLTSKEVDGTVLR